MLDMVELEAPWKLAIDLWSYLGSNPKHLIMWASVVKTYQAIYCLYLWIIHGMGSVSGRAEQNWKTIVGC